MSGPRNLVFRDNTTPRAEGHRQPNEDVRFTRGITKAVHAELEDLVSWLGLAAVEAA
jgi:hypothetical protein